MAYHNNPRIVTDGLVLCLDASHKKSYPGSGTTWYDLSGNGYNGTLVNGVGYVGTNGGSLSFDGVNDYVSVSNSNYLNTNEFTTSLWIYLENITTTYTPRTFLEKNVYNTSGIQFAIGTGGQLTNRILTVRYSTTGNIENVYYFTPSATIVPFQTWINISLVFSYINPNSFISLYINGVLVKTSSASSGTFVPNTKALGIGIPGPGLGNGYHKGKISSYLIYNKALTPQEIQQNFNATKGRFGL
jgi:hypothetical protein